MRFFAPIVACAVACCAAAVFAGSFAVFLADERAKAAARLSLYRSTVDAELRRFSHLTFVLARDPFVIETARGGPTPGLDARLSGFAERAEIDAIYLMDRTGVTRSASNAGTVTSFVGQDYSFRPYFQAAINGAQGEFYGIGATTGIPGYFFAEPVRGPDLVVSGVIAIKIDLSALQDSWQAAGERVILANADGVALLASVPGWRYRALHPLSPAQRARIADTRQFGTQPLAPLDWAPAPRNRATIAGDRLIHLHTSALPNAWTLHYFADTGPAVTRAWLTTGTFVLLAGLFYIWVQFQRTRRIGAALARSEQEEAALRAANERLAVEIEERRAAEQRLQKTQTELERAGRLAALGQLAASVTHELGQPIAAMRNHLAAREIQTGRAPLTDTLQGLVDRMEGITRQLKFFSRKGRDQFEEVDLGDAMQTALALMAPNLETAAVDIAFTAPDAPVRMRANRLRIEQVMTNLLRNALDAVADTATPRIEADVGQDATQIWFEVRDNGHGLGDQSFDELREPFATTRESGHGMGLGLTISAGIVDDHHGEMSACNRPDGGAVFRARFDRAAQEAAA